jgi:hypothetical protein
MRVASFIASIANSRSPALKTPPLASRHASKRVIAALRFAVVGTPLARLTGHRRSNEGRLHSTHLAAGGRSFGAAALVDLRAPLLEQLD